MGTLLAVIAWLGLAGGIIGLASLVILAANPDFADGLFLAIEPVDEETLAILGEDWQQEWEELWLPEGISLDMTVEELLKADREFMREHFGLFSIHGVLSLLFYIAVAVLFLKIASAWRKAEPFSGATIIGMRYLGILLLAQFLFGFVYEAFVPESLSELLISSYLYDMSLDMVAGSYGPNLEAGILFLTLSWVLEYGRNIAEEQDLTV